MIRNKSIRLGVNIDHVATIRQARGTCYPDLVKAAKLAQAGGADSITIHLREDRRHIQDADAAMLISEPGLRVNLEMAVTEEMVAIASELRPKYCCLVPENREELTTEGGLDVAGNLECVTNAITKLREAGMQPALFIDPEVNQLQAAVAAGCGVVELHTGTYANAEQEEQRELELERLKMSAIKAGELGLVVHAGHGLTVGNVAAIANLPQIEELNIGHAIVARALFVGLSEAVSEMKREIRNAEAT